MASLSYLPSGQEKSVRLLPDVMHWSSRSASDAMGDTFQDVSALIAHMRRLFKIETITGHFVVRSEGESRKKPSRRFRPISGARRIPPRPTYDIFPHGILPNTNIQRIDLYNLGDDQFAANRHSVAPASLYAIFHQGHFGHFTSLECPTIPPDAPFPTIDALKISQARLLHSSPARPRPVEITG